MKIIACIEDLIVIRKIFDHLVFPRTDAGSELGRDSFVAVPANRLNPGSKHAFRARIHSPCRLCTPIPNPALTSPIPQ